MIATNKNIIKQQNWNKRPVGIDNAITFGYEDFNLVRGML